MYVFNILCEISKLPFEISHKILNPYTAKYAFYKVLKFDELWYLKRYDILSLNETGPCTRAASYLHPFLAVFNTLLQWVVVYRVSGYIQLCVFKETHLNVPVPV